MTNASPPFDFREGQCWTYRTRPCEPDATLQIRRIEHDARFGEIFHIGIANAVVRNTRAPTGVTSALPHVPVSRVTLEASCLALIGTDPIDPTYLEGYAQWREAFERQSAGVFTIPVAEIVDVIEGAING